MLCAGATRVPKPLPGVSVGLSSSGHSGCNPGCGLIGFLRLTVATGIIGNFLLRTWLRHLSGQIPIRQRGSLCSTSYLGFFFEALSFQRSSRKSNSETNHLWKIDDPVYQSRFVSFSTEQTGRLCSRRTNILRRTPRLLPFD